MEESEGSDEDWEGWELLHTGRSPTEVIVESQSSATLQILLFGVVLLVYGLGFFFFPLQGLPNEGAVGLLLLGVFLCIVRLFFADTVLWDLRNKRAFRVLSFAGSKWVNRTFEGDEVFVVVVEATSAGYYGLSMVTRFGHRYQVLPPRYDRSSVKTDAERLARYFDVSVKEGTPDVVPSARSGKAPIIRWRKRPKHAVRFAFLATALLLPLLAHVAEPLLARLQGA
jgi:hypothetical protein